MRLASLALYWRETNLLNSHWNHLDAGSLIGILPAPDVVSAARRWQMELHSWRIPHPRDRAANMHQVQHLDGKQHGWKVLEW